MELTFLTMMLETNMKGRRIGSTFVYHSISPFDAPDITKELLYTKPRSMIMNANNEIINTPYR